MNLNNAEEFTVDNVALLIASKDDSTDRQLRVKKDGTIFLSEDVGADNIDGLAFRFETWDSGNGYCGEEAAQDEYWVETIYRMLKSNWPVPKDTYIDGYCC